MSYLFWLTFLSPEMFLNLVARLVVKLAPKASKLASIGSKLNMRYSLLIQMRA